MVLESSEDGNTKAVVGERRRTCSASVLGRRRRGSQGSFFFLLFADSGWNGNEREVEMLRMNLFTTSTNFVLLKIKFTDDEFNDSHFNAHLCIIYCFFAFSLNVLLHSPFPYLFLGDERKQEQKGMSKL